MAVCTAPAQLTFPAAAWDTRAVGQLKSLTGNDLITADVKYQPRIKFRNTATFLFGTNHPVMTAEPDPAFFQRMVVIPFRYAVPKEQQEEYLQQRFQQERDAIITKAIFAYLELKQRRYRFSGSFKVNKVVAQGESIPLTADEAIFGFIRSNCSVDQSAVTFSDDLYRAFSLMYPRLLDIRTFSNKFFSYADALSPGKVRKTRRRQSSGGNPTSAFEGIALLDTPSERRVGGVEDV